MAAVAGRRRVVMTKVKQQDDVNELATRLATKLKVSSATTKTTTVARGEKRTTEASQPTKPKTSEKSGDDQKTSLMKNMNSALQTLSVAIQAEWKATAGRKRVMFNNTDMMALAKSARCSLSLLRGLMPGNLDVERAALSLVAKLTSVDMFESATDALADIRESTVKLYEGGQEDDVPSKSGVLSLLCLPVPSSGTTLDPSLQTLISSYFPCAVSSVLNQVISQDILEENFVYTLTAPGCFASWIPLLQTVPSTTIDSILKRNYMVLTSNLGSSSSVDPGLLLELRFFALRSMLLASSVESNAFWEQCTRFAGSYIKASAVTGGEGDPEMILRCFDDVVRCAEQRQTDVGLLSGPSWVSFCEYWLAIARKSKKMETLDRIVQYIQRSPTSSKTTIPSPSSDFDINHEIVKLGAGFSQMNAFLDNIADKGDEEVERRVTATIGLIADFKRLVDQQSTSVPSPDFSKLKRALERLRRGITKALEHRHVGNELLCELLENIVDCIQSTSSIDADSTISILDSLFALATSGLDIQQVDTCDKAYRYLTKAEDVIQRYINSIDDAASKKNTANYLRCTSGAYYNVAGNLYKGEKYGSAIRFLNRACPLGQSSIDFYDAFTSSSVDVSGGRKGSEDDDKDREVWRAHKAQLYKRWELLGICYGKLPDRKLAHEAFVKAIATYPYDEHFSSTVLNEPSMDIFSLPDYRVLGNMIDRTTYIGAAELFLEKEASLLGALESLPSEVAAAILERQIISLNESRWKPTVGKVVEVILGDLLHILGTDQPIRRAKLLIAQLEHFYYSGNAMPACQVDTIADEIRQLLDQASDAPASNRRTKLHYAALAHLWLAIIRHGNEPSSPKDSVLSHTNEAHGLLTSLLSILSAAPKDDLRNKGTKSSSKESKGITATKRRQPVKATRSAPSKIAQTPARSIVDPVPKNNPAVTDETHNLLTVIRIVIEMLGLMGHIYAKMQLLVIERQLIENVDGSDDAYLTACTDFGYELVKLGKIGQAIDIYASALQRHGNVKLTSGPYVLLQLRYAESLAMSGDLTRSIEIYEEASNACDSLGVEDKPSSILARTRERVMTIERSAVAFMVFGTLQLVKNSSSAALKSYLQALRLLNRSVDCLSKLTSPRVPTETNGSQDPFSTLENANTLGSDGAQQPSQTAYKRTTLGGHEWRVASSLFDVMFTLSTVYFMRGSSREAEYFAKQAEDLARCINSPAILCRALCRQSELLLYLGKLDEAKTTLAEASETIGPSMTPIGFAEASRLKGDHLQKISLVSDAAQMYESAAETLEKIGETFVAFDYEDNMRRKSNITSPKSPRSIKVPVASSILALVLKQHVWLLRKDEESFERLLQQFLALPQSVDVQAQTNSLLGKLALHNIHERFLSDMALNSLAESTVALPMGMLCDGPPIRTPTRDVIEALNSAEEIYATGLTTFYERANVTHMRDSAVSLALVKAFQTALGTAGSEGPAVAARFLDLASSITLKKELIESIPYKFPEVGFDDLQWPSFVPRPRRSRVERNVFDDSTDDDEDDQEVNMRSYWEDVLKRHDDQVLVTEDLSDLELKRLPHNWAVVSISLTEDKNTLLLARQRANKEPFVFCIPLRGRRENDDNEHFTFDDAIAELKNIIHCSDEGTRSASQIDKEDKEGKAAWWAERKALDSRMRSLLENIEYCWLGAFKSILAQPARVPPEVILSFRTRIEKVFRDLLKPHEKKLKKTKFKFENCLLELFATLPPDCRDEELEDIIYFILDLYHFHGVQISPADIDVDVVGVDLRTAMEEHHRQARGRITVEPGAHTFLVLDKNVQGIPWESIPILRGKSVSRIPSVSFLLDRLDLAMVQKGLSPREQPEDIPDRIAVDPSSAYYVLNPAGDLPGTEGRFKDWIEKMRRVGWEGVVGRPPSEQQLLNALTRKDLVVYFGHGGAEQYIRSHKIRHLQRCAATMLWGCSSGALRDMGEFERIGTPNNYMLAGCPTLVANLWDVTDRDIDKFALSVFDKLSLQPEEVKKWKTGRKRQADCKMSVVSAVAQSRDACKLKYLTGAAVVVYGIPFYL